MRIDNGISPISIHAPIVSLYWMRRGDQVEIPRRVVT